MRTQTGDSMAYANPLKLLASKPGDFLRYSPASENIGRSESISGHRAGSALPSYWLHTAQMLGFRGPDGRAENCLKFEGGRGKGAGN